MAVNVGSVEVLLTLRDALTAALEKPKANLVRISAEVRKLDVQLLKHEEHTRKVAREHDRAAVSVDKFGRQIRTTLVHVLAAGAAYKALGAAVKSVTDVVELVRTFEKIENVTGVTREEVDRLRASLNTLSTATGKGPQELAEGFYAIASSGIDGAKATEILTASARASAVGLGETKDIARSITAAINAYGQENLSAAKAADILFATVREGGAEASEVAGVFGRVVGIASQLGVSFAEVGSFIATFTRLGVGADEAVTALRGSLTAMLTPTRNQEEALKAVGSSMAELRAQVREKGLTAALIELTRASQGNEDIIGAVIPNVRSLAGVLGVAGKQAESYIDVTREVTGSTGDLGRAFDDVSKSASFQWDKLKAQFQQLSISLGQELLPGVLAFRNAIASMDEGELRQLGTEIATALSALAKVVVVVVDNLDLLAAAIVGILVLKFATAISGWVVALGAVPPVAAAATSSTAALGASIARLAGPIGIVMAAGYLLHSKIQQWAADSSREIERMVTEMEAAGRRLDLLRGESALGIDVNAERAAVAESSRLIDEYNKKLDALIARRQAAKQSEHETGAMGRAVVKGIDEQISATQDLIVKEELRNKQASALVGKYEGLPAQLERIGEGLDANVVAPVKLADAGAASFANRISEITSKLKDQLEAARADLTLAKARRDEGNASIRNARELSVEARAQLEVTKVLNSLESTKHQLSAAIRAEIERLVTAWVHVKDEIKLVNDETRKQEIDARNQERALAQMYRIAEQRAAAERKVTAEMDAQVEALQDQFAEAAINLDTSKKMLAALLAHGQQAARAAEIQGELEKEHVINAQELAMWLAQVEEEQAKINYLIGKVAELSKPAWQVYLDAAFDAINAIGDALSDVITQAAMEGKVNWESVWEGLKSSLIRIFADMLADMLKRWIATQLAMRAASQTINAGGGTTGGGGGIGGAFSSMGMSAFGGTSGGSTAGMSTSTMLGAGLAAYALFVVYKGFIEDHKRKFSGVTLGDQGQIMSTAGHGKKYMQGLLDTVDALLTSLRDWLKEADIAMKKFASITLEADKSGFSLRSGATIIGHFKTAEEAISAAQAFMLKFGEFADSVPELIRAAVRSSDMNMESITSNVNFARTLLTQNMEQFALGIHDATELFLEQMRRSFELFGQMGVGRNFNATALLEATGSAMTFFTNSLTQLYNQLTGHKEDPIQAAERQRQAYNAQRAIMIAQITLLYEEVRARVAVVQAQIAMLTALRQGGFEGGGGGPGPGGPRSGGGGENPFPTIHTPRKGGGAFVIDERNPSNNPQLAALLAVLDNLARVLAGLPPEIAPGGVQPGAGGGRGRGQRQQVEDFIEQQRFQLAQAGRSPLAREIEEIRRAFAEQLEAAGKNVKLRRELLALEQASIEAARRRFQEDVENRFKDITGQNNAFTELHRRFADMRRDILDAGFAADRAAEMLAQLAEAEREAVRVLSEQMAADLLGGLAQYIEDEQVRAEFLRQAAILKFNLDMANYKAQLAILRALGTVSDEVLNAIQRAIDWIEDNPPNFDRDGGGPNTDIYVDQDVRYRRNRQLTGEAAPTGGPTGREARDRALELLARYQNEALSRWHQALKQLNDDFVQIRAALGDTPEIANEYADALARLREEFLAGIRDYYDQLRNFGSSQSVAQQFQAAQARYAQLFAAVAGGDLSQADAFQAAADQLEQLAQQMFGTATGEYQDIRSRILADLEAILGITSAPNNVIGGPEWFSAGNAATVAATAHVADVVSLSGVRRDQWLQRIDEKLGQLLGGGGGEPIDDTTPFSYGDMPRRLPRRSKVR